MEEKLIYNSIILYNYLRYLEYNYPNIDRDKILHDSGIEPWETDPGHWFSQEVMNRFHACILKATKNPNISIETGRFSAISWPNNFLREMALSFLSPSNFYDKIGSIIPLYSKAINVTSQKISKNRFEICMSFKEGIKPQKHQCENFQGYLEAITLVYRKKLPIVEHNECFFTNSDQCKYIISGTHSIAQLLNTVKFIVLISWVPAVLMTWPFKFNNIYLGSLLILFLALSFLAERIEKKELLHTFSQQKLKPSDLYKGYSKYYDATKIIREASFNLSRITSIEIFAQRLSDIFSNLGHKSGIIGIINNETTSKPFCENLYAFIENFEGLRSLQIEASSSFILLPPNLEKTTIRNFDYFKSFLPPWLIESCGCLSNIEKIVFTPILHENSLLGFVIIANKFGTPLQESDLFLIEAVASQAALSLTNILYFKSLLNAESLKNDFLTVAAHELLTPIQVATTALHYIKMKSGDELEQSVKILDKAIIKLDSLGKSLISLSANLETMASLDFVEFDEILELIKNKADAIASYYGHIIEYSITDIISVRCNEKLFVESISALIENAAKYTPRGGIIKFSTYVKPTEFIISVKDNGIGINEKYHEKIFLRFFQIESNSNGVGIGLFYCSDVINKHGGYITIKSPIYPRKRERKGSEFTIHIPISFVKLASQY